MNPLLAISAFLAEGGPVMYLIGVVFVAGVGLAVERVFALHSATRSRNPNLVPEMLAKIDRDEVRGAFELCRSASGVLAGTLAEVLGTAAAPSGPLRIERLRERAEQALTLRLAALEERTDLLATGANTTTMLGLLGTVVGLMQAFGPGAQVGFTSTVSSSLHATAFGIVAALPLLLAQSYLRSRIDSAAGEARGAAEQLIVALARRARAEQALAQRTRSERPGSGERAGEVEVTHLDRRVANRHGSLLAR